MPQAKRRWCLGVDGVKEMVAAGQAGAWPIDSGTVVRGEEDGLRLPGGLNGGRRNDTDAESNRKVAVVAEGHGKRAGRATNQTELRGRFGSTGGFGTEAQDSVGYDRTCEREQHDDDDEGEVGKQAGGRGAGNDNQRGDE
jgi:hypothetical protein